MQTTLRFTYSDLVTAKALVLHQNVHDSLVQN